MKKSISFKPDKERIVEILFRENFEALCRLSASYVADPDASKDIVHDVFIRFWNQYDSLPNDSNYKSYLFKAVRNKSLNYLRDKKLHLDVETVNQLSPDDAGTVLEQQELEAKIRQGLLLLPEKCLEVFELSRFKGLKYQEIADRLEISVKTVEAQMSKALKILREHLKDFLTLIFFYLFS